LCGFLVLLSDLGGIMSGISTLIHSALTAVSELVGARAPGVP
jgi:hypothetical protein